MSPSKLSVYLDECSELHAGKRWDEFKSSKSSTNVSCRDLFADAATTFKSRVDFGSAAISPENNRLKHKVGTHIPVFAPTALLNSKARIHCKKARYSDDIAIHSCDIKVRKELQRKS